jgi:crotonobetainyl-CoA:carnitine CoA-transferase CaiB-like acyl-CoA transferase
MAPLDGITVLDLTRVLSGPYCTMLLADMGARVIKVEQPGKGDDTRAWGPPFLYPSAQSPRAGDPEKGESAYFLSINRNKESVTIDFKQPEGRALLEQLIVKADVLVENFRPGILTRLGLDYETLSKKYPRLVYCSISGFGHSGPRWKQPGYDAIMQAEGGLMSITGTAEGPPVRLGVAIVDIVSGMFAAYGIAMALLARERTGKGQEVDLAMLDATVALLTYQAGNYFASGKAPARLGNRHPSIVPYETFTASDGDFVLAVGNDDQWRTFCGVARLVDDGRFATNRQRVSGYDSLRPFVADRLSEQTRQHWIDALTAAGVPCGSVRTFDELFADPQIDAREMIAMVEHATIGSMKALGVPVKLSDTPGAIRTPPPTLGQHTDAVLQHDLGLSADAIANLRREQVI